MKKTNIFGIYPKQLKDFLKETGKSYLGEQVLDWIYQKGKTDFGDMTNLAKSEREKLAEEFSIGEITTEEVLSSPDKSHKFLFKLADGNLIESVLMMYDNRYSACLSTQVGCRFRCTFCASGKNGLVRNLSPAEIVEQLFHLTFFNPRRKVKNLVFMGVGEPLENYDNLLEAMDIISHFKTFNIGQRRVVISTVGLPEKIVQLADSGRRYKLAVSLHAPSDNLRTKLMPQAVKYATVDDLIEVAKYYQEKTRRRITIEYILIDDINDKDAHAYKLGRLLKGTGFLLNLIPYNPISKVKYNPSRRIDKFKQIVSGFGINITVRYSKGKKITGSCGQLRAKKFYG
jgi:23S rRNA (adenine2503-C2)-methyltransferase